MYNVFLFIFFQSPFFEQTQFRTSNENRLTKYKLKIPPITTNPNPSMKLVRNNLVDDENNLMIDELVIFIKRPK